MPRDVNKRRMCRPEITHQRAFQPSLSADDVYLFQVISFTATRKRKKRAFVCFECQQSTTISARERQLDARASYLSILYIHAPTERAGLFIGLGAMDMQICTQNAVTVCLLLCLNVNIQCVFTLGTPKLRLRVGYSPYWFVVVKDSK